jgi:3-oxoacyl-[acyl-carrier protein] reductase
MGMAEVTASRAFSLMAAVMSVSMNPGATAFTVMPREATSRATDFVKPTIPALLAARDAARLAEAVDEIRACGGKAEAVAVDVAERSSVEAAVASVVAAHGRLDHLVNNAGVTRDNLLLRMKDDEWQQVLATNLTGAFLCTQAALKPMLKQRTAGSSA